MPAAISSLLTTPSLSLSSLPRRVHASSGTSSLEMFPSPFLSARFSISPGPPLPGSPFPGPPGAPGPSGRAAFASSAETASSPFLSSLPSLFHASAGTSSFEILPSLFLSARLNISPGPPLPGPSPGPGRSPAPGRAAAISCSVTLPSLSLSSLLMRSQRSPASSFEIALSPSLSMDLKNEPSALPFPGRAFSSPRRGQIARAAVRRIEIDCFMVFR